MLQRWSRGRSTPSRLVLRTKILLAAAAGQRNDKITKELDTQPRTVGIWRNRFATGWLASSRPRRVAGATRQTRSAGLADCHHHHTDQAALWRNALEHDLRRFDSTTINLCPGVDSVGVLRKHKGVVVKLEHQYRLKQEFDEILQLLSVG